MALGLLAQCDSKGSVAVGADSSKVVASAPASAPTLVVSEAIDALCLLNALSDQAPYADQYPEERAEWRERLGRVSGGMEAVQPWIGDAAFLVHVYAGTADDLAGLIAVVRGPIPDPHRVVEPSYRARLDELAARRTELVRALEAIAHAGFHEHWQAETEATLAERLPALRTAYEAFSEDEVAAALRPFLGDAAARSGSIYVAHFNRPFALSLPGGGAVIHDRVEPAELWSLLLHERLHQIDPSAATLALYQELGQVDPWIGERQRVVLGQFQESREEELVIAVESTVAVRLGLMTRKQALRRMTTTMGGVPVAALMFERLTTTSPAEPHALDRVVADELEQLVTQGDATTKFATLVHPVSGSTGMRIVMDGIHPTIAEVFPSTPAAEAGLAAGDIIVAVAGAKPRETLADVLDQLVGPSEQPVVLTVARGGARVDVTLIRGRIPTIPPAPSQ